MIISGYDIGPLASAALHMAGAYTPSYSNSFKVHMMTNTQLGKNGVNNAKLTAASTDSYCAPKNAHSLRAESFPSSIKDKGRIGMRTGSSDRNMKDINSLRKIKCFDFDILQIIKSHSSSSSRTRTSSGSSSSSSSSRRECQRIKVDVLVSDRTRVLEASVPIGCITHLQANSLPSSGDIITSMGAATAAIKAEVAHVEDDDYSGDEALYLDTPQGVFVYLHDHQGDRETGAEADENSKIEGSRKKAGKAEVNGSVDDEDEDKDDDEDEYEGDIEDNWRDQGSVEEEEEEEGDEEEENGKVSEFGRRENDLGNNNGLDRTSKKRKSLRDGDVHTFTPTQGSMLKLLTSSIDGICIGRLRCFCPALSESFTPSVLLA